uniref:Uncharacterized protein n=1 Tax=Arundo donax TaxID=35708 RepID=A0A0A9A8U4_ARUDO
MPVDLWVPFVHGRARLESTAEALAELEPLVPAEAARPWVLLLSAPRLGDVFDCSLNEVLDEQTAAIRECECWVFK